MKKYAIYEPETPFEPDTVYLRLLNVGEGICMAVVGEDGEVILDTANDQDGGALVILTEDGKLSRQYSVMKSLGFQLDFYGRVQLDEMFEAKGVRSIPQPLALVV